MRRYDFPVLVRTVDPPVGVGGPDGRSEGPLPPAQFLWHDRLYIVREVLAQWRERTAWWSGAAGRGVHGESAPDAPTRAAPAGIAPPGEAREPGPAGRRGAVQERWDAADRWVWRVEASAGRSGVTGTYDLSREGPPEGGERSCSDGSRSDGSPRAQEPTWRLVRVCD